MSPGTNVPPSTTTLPGVGLLQEEAGEEEEELSWVT